MRIEVAAPPDQPGKVKGDLLEGLAIDLLKTQQFDVTNQVRMTGTEVDLYCTHRVSRETIYVECKAHRDSLSANILKTLLGELTFGAFSAVWLISAGPLGKDAEGMRIEWESRDISTSAKFRVYTPERVIDALKAAGVICDPPNDLPNRLDSHPDEVGEPFLLVSPYGRHWIVPMLASGVPTHGAVFRATDGQAVSDVALLTSIKSTDSSAASLDLLPGKKVASSDVLIAQPSSLPAVIQVSTGESWKDYRPARPQDFVGRRSAQTEILHLLDRIRSRETVTRVFAVTGDSGMGKSSLIAKLRARVKNVYYRRKHHVFAVDVRAAKSSLYVLSAFIEALTSAADHFGIELDESVRVTDVAAPLSDPSVQKVIVALEAKKCVVCLVLDQFEELYSKPELFPLFDSVRTLMSSVISLGGPIVLGFAWKSDATVHQEHPAYYMWHQLADHRYQVHLRAFSASEAGQAVTAFQRELGQDLRPQLRRQLIENSQGFPWLLKKLAIHIYDQLNSGASQTELIDRALDVASLFQRDLAGLSGAETSCLKHIAENSPADSYEVFELFGTEVVRQLVDRRLIVRSGDRINVYWDIFQEYVLTQQVPKIPLTYVPSSPSLSALIRLAVFLDVEDWTSLGELAALLKVGEKTVGNILRDLVMFGIAQRSDAGARLDPDLDDNTPKAIVQQIRRVLLRHALVLRLDEIPTGAILRQNTVVELLKETLPTAQHRQKTWVIYADRMLLWLSAAGIVSQDETGQFFNQDAGEIHPELAGQRRGRQPGGAAFLGDAPPEKAVEALESAIESSGVTASQVHRSHHRNGFFVLRDLGLLQVEKGLYRVRVDAQANALMALWAAAQNHPTLQLVRTWLNEDPGITGKQVGAKLNVRYDRSWKSASQTRTGNAVLRWARWLNNGTATTPAPYPTRASRKLRRHSAEHL